MFINDAIHILRNPYGHSAEAIKEAQLLICDAYEEESKAHQANRKLAEQHGIDTTVYCPASAALSTTGPMLRSTRQDAHDEGRTDEQNAVCTVPNTQVPEEWRELCRRLYVELFHCDQQMMSATDEEGEPLWTQGSSVRDVLRDAKEALAASAAPSSSAVMGSEPEPAKVMVHRNKVWIVRGAQSFGLAYEADTDEELNWYADKLRKVIAAAPMLNTKEQPQ
jgi:hypothetical protein